ncbi:hypothetical protein ACA910_020142 [Epithemia clementina (nom. ined.)]
MCSSLGEGSQCCAFYSATGFVFCLWVGLMLQFQPFFVGGIEDPEEAKKNAFGATGMFLVTFLASVMGIWLDSGNKAEPVDVNGTEGDYQLASDDVPTYGTTH